jgi:hypothetical protein
MISCLSQPHLPPLNKRQFQKKSSKLHLPFFDRLLPTLFELRFQSVVQKPAFSFLQPHDMVKLTPSDFNVEVQGAPSVDRIATIYVLLFSGLTPCSLRCESPLLPLPLQLLLLPYDCSFRNRSGGCYKQYWEDKLHLFGSGGHFASCDLMI